MTWIYHSTILVFRLVSIGIGLAALGRYIGATNRFRLLLSLCLVALALHIWLLYQHELFGFDYRIFWRAGADALGGKDPYASADGEHFVLINPPSSLPVLATFALVGERTSLGIWTIINFVGLLGLPFLALAALRSQASLGPGGSGAASGWVIPFEALAALSVCLAFSAASLKGLLLGQLSVFTAVMLLQALIGQGRGQPVRAGICLFLSAVKIHTAVPFLLLYLRPEDRRTWIVFLGLTLGACWINAPLGALPARAGTVVTRIVTLAAPGNVNDYSFAGTRHESIISLEHAFYRLGLRDRTQIAVLEAVSLLALGVGIATLVLTGRLTRPASASLVAIFCLLFLYHRDYDTVILILPLAFCVARLGGAEGRARRLYVACGMALIAVLNVDSGLMRGLAEASFTSPRWGGLVQATILSCSVWLLLAAMCLLLLAERTGEPTTGQGTAGEVSDSGQSIADPER